MNVVTETATTGNAIDGRCRSGLETCTLSTLIDAKRSTLSLALQAICFLSHWRLARLFIVTNDFPQHPPAVHVAPTVVAFANGLQNRRNLPRDVLMHLVTRKGTVKISYSYYVGRVQRKALCNVLASVRPSVLSACYSASVDFNPAIRRTNIYWLLRLRRQNYRSWWIA